ncbi:MAG: TldD/PmbA family protein [Candidatus Cloacimonetes bacterium]|nr:TldD/PmbA family protein [Candidatus Cloacimonadota bacterium]MCF7813077.1 TldD/PmbA family protein [Candidatus Cloacimonadota bacterium]MCF7867182.1 TldD/PmbA family protein [Candidatus Cloacimonadota bacterium]MCF7882626.1 TldD/PmbA family protein [Candidatus Cloacimonadota bacterium]
MNLREQLVEICQMYPDLKLNFNYSFWETDFLRFYQSQINYNISKTSISLSTTIYKGKKSYSFSLKDPTREILLEKIEEVLPLIDKLPEDPDFIDLEDDPKKSGEKEKTNNIETVNIDTKIDILQKVADAVKPYNFKIYGTFICNYRTLYIINSNGLNKREISTPIYFETKAVSNKNEVTVLEVFGGENFDLFDQEKFISSLESKVKSATEEVIDVEPGEYDVILAPRCIGEYFYYLESSMTAGSLDHKQSFFEAKLDKKVFPENVTLMDDPNHPEMINFDYNSDGRVYPKIPIIEKGVFKNFLVSNYYGRKLKMDRNGADGEALVMLPGNKSLTEMIGTIKKGLYISSLHYMNFINRKETSITGLTRDGTFLIEDGKITKVVNNLRFTEKISEIIENIIDIENETVTIPYSDNYGEFGIYSANMPHVKVKDFNISSSTRTV